MASSRPPRHAPMDRNPAMRLAILTVSRTWRACHISMAPTWTRRSLTCSPAPTLRRAAPSLSRRRSLAVTSCPARARLRLAMLAIPKILLAHAWSSPVPWPRWRQTRPRRRQPRPRFSRSIQALRAFPQGMAFMSRGSISTACGSSISTGGQPSSNPRTTLELASPEVHALRSGPWMIMSTSVLHEPRARQATERKAPPVYVL
mmetsp:Transcript_16520/g.42392  ORF Transcript_16520/g.42392 Transcript_16520/m.42392 type:complete len:203 (+) Transcript_16520:765-1373(+)